MSSRTYAQFCGLAAAMDVLGERWAVLVVRDLLTGPRRYTDLHKALPGISTDMLATRLSELERAGLVARSVLAVPGAPKVYELTDVGRSLEPALRALARWGLHRLTTSEYAAAPVAREWIEFALRAAYEPTHGPRRRRRVRFTIDGHVVVVAVSRTGIETDPDGDLDVAVDVEVSGPSRALIEALVDPARAARLLEEGVIAVTGADDVVAEALGGFRVDPDS